MLQTSQWEHWVELVPEEADAEIASAWDGRGFLDAGKDTGTDSLGLSAVTLLLSVFNGEGIGGGGRELADGLCWLFIKGSVRVAVTRLGRGWTTGLLTDAAAGAGPDGAAPLVHV